MFFTDNQLEILSIFFSSPARELHMSELGRILGKKPGYFQKGLNKLEAVGILKSRRQGNQRVLSLNARYRFLDEVRSIVEKSAGAVSRLMEIMGRHDEVACAFLYGSFAHGKMRPNSDVDIIIVCPAAAQGALLKEFSKLEEVLLREINPKFYTSDTFKKKQTAGDSFLDEVLSKKVIMLKGSL